MNSILPPEKYVGQSFSRRCPSASSTGKCDARCPRSTVNSSRLIGSGLPAFAVSPPPPARGARGGGGRPPPAGLGRFAAQRLGHLVNRPLIQLNRRQRKPLVAK